MNETTSQPTPPRYYAARPFVYNGVDLCRGQVIHLAGALNDEKLVRLSYLAPVPDHAALHRCEYCDSLFVSAIDGSKHTAAAHQHSRPGPSDAVPRHEDFRPIGERS